MCSPAQNSQALQENNMLTTLCILSLDQGKIAPRYDIEPMSMEEAAEAGVGTMQEASWHAGRSTSEIWKGLLVRIATRIGGSLSHA